MEGATTALPAAATRRRRRAPLTLRLSRGPIHLYTSGRLPPIAGMPSRALVSTFYPDGRPAPCSVELRSGALQYRACSGWKRMPCPGL